MNNAYFLALTISTRVGMRDPTMVGPNGWGDGTTLKFHDYSRVMSYHLRRAGELNFSLYSCPRDVRSPQRLCGLTNHMPIHAPGRRSLAR